MNRKVSFSQPRVYGKLAEPSLALKADYQEQRWTAVMGDMINKFTCPEKSILSFKIDKGDLCRVRMTLGAQVKFMFLIFKRKY